MFDEVHVISLERRQDRLQKFFESLPSDWPFKQPEVFTAIDGKVCKAPAWWKQGNGAWGCYRSHLQLIESCMLRGVKSVLILEDDALCVSDFTKKWNAIKDHVPKDWEMLYLGGQHLGGKNPTKFNDYFNAPHNVNRTHAYALNTPEFMLSLYQYLADSRTWRKGQHIDHRLGELTSKKRHKVYAVNSWLIGQDENVSDIAHKEFELPRFWKSKGDVTIEDTFAIIVGLHRSGSSCLAGVLHNLGVHMGVKFVGCEPNGGYEAATLAHKLEQAMPFPGTRQRINVQGFLKNIHSWVVERCEEAKRNDTIAGGKYPHLCVYGEAFRHMFGVNLKVIHASRPLEDSIASLILREGKRHDHRKLKKVQEYLFEHKQKFLEKVEHITVEYAELLQNPQQEVQRIAEYLQLEMTEDAVKYVDPRRQKIGVAS